VTLTRVTPSKARVSVDDPRSLTGGDAHVPVRYLRLTNTGNVPSRASHKERSVAPTPLSFSSIRCRQLAVRPVATKC